MSKSKQWLLTAIYTLGWSFVSGTAILFGLAVPLEAYLAEQQYAQATIDLLMYLPILFWLLVSALTGFLYFLWLPRAEKRSLLTHAGMMLASLTLCAWLLLQTNNPLLNLVRGTPLTPGNRFIFGPYPDIKQLQELRQKGVKDIISLLNPAIPFEKTLLEREKTNCQALGLNLHSFPMLPWVSENKQALQAIHALVQAQPDRSFYIHCYLGRHRADLVHRLLSPLDGSGAAALYLYPDHLERGPLCFFTGGNLVLGPYPTEEEWFQLLQRGQFTRVISWLDPADPEDRPWLEQEKQICRELELELVNLPLGHNPQPAQLKAWAKVLTHAEGKIYLHGFRHDSRSQLLTSFLQQGKWPAAGQLPPLPRGVDLAAAQKIQPALEKVTAYLLVGPALTPQQLPALKQAGLSTLVVLEGRHDLTVPEVARLQEEARKTGLAWLAVSYRTGYEAEILQLANSGRSLYVLTTSAGKLQIARDLEKYKL